MKIPNGAAFAVQLREQFPGGASTGAANSTCSPKDTVKAAFDKTLAAIQGASTHAISVKKPEAVSPKAARDVAKAVAEGARIAADGFSIGDGDGFIIGYDLGTSSTKVILRRPFHAGKPAHAIKVPSEMRADGVAHLWHTAIWLGDDGTLSLLPGEKRRMVDGFKSALLNNQGRHLCPGTSMSNLEATVAFLALHIAYVLGTASMKSANQPTFERLHLGVPVAALTSGEIARYFNAALRFALALVEKAEELTLEEVRATVESALPEEAPLASECFPELVAAIAGYANTRDAKPGPHMVIDVGAGTLDIATFELPVTKDRALPIHVARVEQLGAEACDWATEAGVSLDDCKKACLYQERLVYGPTVKTKDAIGFAKQDDGFSYGVITIGGGRRSDIHVAFLTQLGGAFSRAFIEPRLLKGVTLDRGAQTDRLLLADGLANDPMDIRPWLLPDDRDHVAASRIDYSGRYIDKDQV